MHCASLANDGLVYVCDRVNDRIQVFSKDGTYIKEAQIAKRTLGDGVTFDIAFSKDPQQRLMYVADGANHRVWQLLRDPMLVLNHIGNGGRYPGPVLRDAQRLARLEGQPLHGRDLHRRARAEVHVQGTRLRLRSRRETTTS